MPPLLLLASPHSVPVTAVSGHRPTAHLRYPLASPNQTLNLSRASFGDLGGGGVEARGIPPHLIHAITSSEDRRFFFHPGVDCHGISRAIVKYPNGGGGSTITQQLMKRIFLTSERKISRKFIEGLLSLMIEKRMSKTKIFYSYLSTMYWGHGIFGIESASSFYFQKQPIFLTVGESALLAGILPAPEILNPFTDPRRLGKSSQQRVLRRMVAEGFLDMETALKVAKQPLCLHKENKLCFAVVDPPTTRSFFDAPRPLDPMHLQGGSTLNETTRAACCICNLWR
uniref:Glycosyl transferase family 51 domain-containing protein n=1 Tax=Ananas comosus var. bracteatus TaxID=296719 RepID=A0A6V7P8E3_ANACO|nr:unnamed protein product [Ananas comosus var. bracteatus]